METTDVMAVPIGGKGNAGSTLSSAAGRGSSVKPSQSFDRTLNRVQSKEQTADQPAPKAEPSKEKSVADKTATRDFAKEDAAAKEADAAIDAVAKENAAAKAEAMDAKPTGNAKDAKTVEKVEDGASTEHVTTDGKTVASAAYMLLANTLPVAQGDGASAGEAEQMLAMLSGSGYRKAATKAELAALTGNAKAAQPAEMEKEGVLSTYTVQDMESLLGVKIDANTPQLSTQSALAQAVSVKTAGALKGEVVQTNPAVSMQGEMPVIAESLKEQVKNVEVPASMLRIHADTGSPATNAVVAQDVRAMHGLPVGAGAQLQGADVSSAQSSVVGRVLDLTATVQPKAMEQSSAPQSAIQVDAIVEKSSQAPILQANAARTMEAVQPVMPVPSEQESLAISSINPADMEQESGFGEQNQGQSSSFGDSRQNPQENILEVRGAQRGQLEMPTLTHTPAAEGSFQQLLQKTDNLQAQAQQIPDPNNVRGQIVEQARLIRRVESTEMVLQLKPEHLGELTLKLSVSSNGAVNASFHSDNAHVRTIIENSLVQLRQELNQQGIRVENVDVYAGLDGQLPQGQQGWQQPSEQSQRNSSGNVGEETEDMEVSTVPNTQETETVSADDGVNYLV